MGAGTGDVAADGTGMGADPAFHPPAGGWTPVSPRLATAWRLSMLLTLSPLAVGVIVLAFLPGVPDWAWWGAGAVLVVAGVWLWIVLGRRVRAYGFAERDADLLVVRGIWIRRLVIVPYGRMQLVDVRAGPLDRRLGIATVQVHTAAATSDAAIPGLLPAQAAELRDRLAVLGEERSAGM